MNKLEKLSTQKLSACSPELYTALLTMFSMVKYLKNDLKYIFKMVLKVKTPITLIVPFKDL